MLSKYKAIVLRSIKYGESGIITQVYTETEGRQSFIVHGVRKKNSKISPYFFQPLTPLSIVAYRKESRELHIIKEIQPLIHLTNFHFDIKRNTIAQFISEIIYRCLRENEPNTSLFNYLLGAIQVLDITESHIHNFHLIFMMQFTRFIGIYPKDNTELHQYVSDTTFTLTDLLNYSLSDIKILRLDSKTRSEILNQLLKYYYDHQEGIGEIKSLQVFKEVFSE
ncbi:MAG: DNA repair protein RecO [Bacteroidales bacterium]|nr:DNA repair protein RecO [Bacteroidales bacterium]